MAKVLLLDDDALFREGARRMLESAGFEVTEAANGENAAGLLRNLPDAVVLCDIFMSGKEGLETIRELRQEFPESKIIAMSAGVRRGAMDVFKIALHMGASDILRKPFDQRALLNALERISAK